MNVIEATTKLSAIASVRPEMKPVVDVAVGIAKAAEAEIAQAKAETARAETRAELAERLVDDVRPHLEDVERRAEIAEQACDDMAAQTRKRVEKAVAEDSAEVEQATRRLDRAVAALEKSAVEPVVDLLVACHRLTRNADGKSVIQDFRKYAGAPWEVLNPDDGSITLHESRADAILAVKAMLDKKCEVGSADPDAEDSVDSPRRVSAHGERRAPQPGELHAKAGRFDMQKIVKARVLRVPRIT